MVRNIESNVIKITTEKKLAIKPKKVFMTIELSGSKETFLETKRAADKAKEQFEKFLGKWAVYKRMNGQFLGEVEEVLTYKRPGRKIKPFINEFCLEYEMVMYADVLDYEILKKTMSKIDARTEIHIYNCLVDLEQEREKVLSEALADNRRKAELMAKQLHRNIIGPKTIVYGKEEEKTIERPVLVDLKKITRHDLVYAGKLILFEEEEKQVHRQFKLEIELEEVTVTEKVYMEWEII